MSHPGYLASHRWQVTHNRRILSVLLVLVLDLVHLEPVVMEDDSVLGVQILSQILALQDILELAEQLQRVFDALNDIEILIDELLQFALKSAHIHVKLHEVSVKHVLVVVEEIMLLLSEALYQIIELADQMFHAFEIVLAECLELLHCGEQIHQLVDSASE